MNVILGCTAVTSIRIAGTPQYAQSACFEQGLAANPRPPPTAIVTYSQMAEGLFLILRCMRLLGVHRLLRFAGR